MKRSEHSSSWSRLRLMLVTVSLLLAVSWSAYRVSDKYLMAGAPAFGNGVSYRLVSMGEGLVTEGTFLGDWVLVWFFDTHCPKSTCGPVLQTMSTTKNLLSDDALFVAPLAVTLDPRQDEAEALKNYVVPLSHSVVPLTGSPLMVSRLTRYFKIPIKIQSRPDGTSYHQPAASIMILNPRGQWVDTVPATIKAEALAARLHNLAQKK